MPLPAIVAALARVGAGLAARVGASGVARSLVAAARTTGPAAAKRAAAAAAASRGSAAAATVAGEAGGLGKTIGGAAHVLEDTKLTNAKALFQAIHGQAPSPAAAAAASTQAAPASQVQSAAAGAPPGPAMPASSGAPPVQPANVPTSSGAPPVQPGSTPSSNPRPQGLLDRMGDAFNRAKATYAQAQARFTPIAEQTARMTMDERYARLSQSGKLPNYADVASKFSTPTPSQDQFVEHGESEEERQRQEDIQKSRGAQVGQAAWSAGKKTLASALTATNPATAVTMPAWILGIITAFQALGKTVSDTNRDLRDFDENIADSFARLDYAQLRSRQKVASATSGSASLLNNELTKLMREMQPMRESLTTLVNSVGVLAVDAARIANVMLKPIAAGVHRLTEIAEWWYGRKGTEENQAATKDFLRDIRDGKFKGPTIRKPGEKK